MHRKILKVFTFIYLLTLTTIQLNASTLSFNYVNFFATDYGLVSLCEELDNTSDILTLDIPQNNFTDFSTLGGVDSAVAFYTDTTCQNQLQGFDLYDIQPSSNVNTTYFFEFDYLTPGQTPRSFTLTLATTLTQAQAPSGYVTFMSNNTTFTTTTPNKVIYFSEGEFYYEAYWILNVPQPLPGDPTKLGFTFQYWKDINGNVYNYQLPPQPELLDTNNIFYLEAVFFKDFTITPPGPPGTGQYGPIDTILFNTGFFNTPGFVLLYFILTILLNLGLWNLGSPTIATLIGNITLTSLFMFLGYLPLYVSALMIILFITIGITQSKGGMFSE